MNALIPRNSVETIVSFRDAAISQFEAAFEKIDAADAALKEAAGLWQAAAPTKTNHYYDSAEEVREFFRAVSMPDPSDLYDTVVMNPPFDRERDIDHVTHALSFLKTGGHLVAIMSAGTEFRETRKAIAFRELMESMGAQWKELPPGSFAESGTYVNTVMLSVWKNGTRQRYGRWW